jgi:hypothetical protein
MRHKPRCICGRPYGLISHYYNRIRLCSKLCKANYEAKRNQERVRQSQFYAWLARPS